MDTHLLRLKSTWIPIRDWNVLSGLFGDTSAMLKSTWIPIRDWNSRGLQGYNIAPPVTVEINLNPYQGLKLIPPTEWNRGRRLKSTWIPIRDWNDLEPADQQRLWRWNQLESLSGIETGIYTVHQYGTASWNQLESLSGIETEISYYIVRGTTCRAPKKALYFSQSKFAIKPLSVVEIECISKPWSGKPWRFKINNQYPDIRHQQLIWVPCTIAVHIKLADIRVLSRLPYVLTFVLTLPVPNEKVKRIQTLVQAYFFLLLLHVFAVFFSDCFPVHDKLGSSWFQDIPKASEKSQVRQRQKRPLDLRSYSVHPINVYPIPLSISVPDANLRKAVLRIGKKSMKLWWSSLKQ
jgi:hypothetical protein